MTHRLRVAKCARRSAGEPSANSGGVAGPGSSWNATGSPWCVLHGLVDHEPQPPQPAPLEREARALRQGDLDRPDVLAFAHHIRREAPRGSRDRDRAVVDDVQDLAGVEIDRHDEPLDGVGEDVVVGGVLEIGQRAGDPAAGVLGIGCAGRPRVDLGVLEPLDAADPERLLPARIGAHHPLGERDDASAGRRMRARHLTCDDHAPGLEVDHELDERVIPARCARTWASRCSDGRSRRAMLAKRGRSPRIPCARAASAARVISSASRGSIGWDAAVRAGRDRMDSVSGRARSTRPGRSREVNRSARRQRTAARRHRRCVTPPASRGSRRSRRSAPRAPQPRPRSRSRPCWPRAWRPSRAGRVPQ